MVNRIHRIVTSSAAICVLLSGTLPVAHGTVLPSSAQPNGYSLAQLAAATGVYNTGAATSNPATPAPPNIPFTVLEGATTVNSSTDLYLPIFYADNSAPVDPAFPASITNQATDAAYLDNLVTSYGVTAFFVTIDGQQTILDDSYIVGVTTPTLLDGTPGGNDYITIAAVLSPLSPGSHTIGYGGIGNVHTDDTFTVVSSVPEPGSVGMLCVAGAALCRRRRLTRWALGNHA